VPRAMFGILNTLLFFPSGAIYPIQAFPPVVAGYRQSDPFTYAVDGFKVCLLHRGTYSGGGLRSKWLFLSIFAAVTLGIAIPLFKRARR